MLREFSLLILDEWCGFRINLLSIDAFFYLERLF